MGLDVRPMRAHSRIAISVCACRDGDDERGGLPSMTAIRAKVRAESVRKTKTKAWRDSAAITSTNGRFRPEAASAASPNCDAHHSDLKGGGKRSTVRGLCRKAVDSAGHRDREGPFRAYCAGLLGTEGRKSVEPLAAATAPWRFRASISRCCISWDSRSGRTRRCWPRRALGRCRRSSGRVRSRHGSSTTRVSPSRAGIRSEWRGNIAGNSASGPTAGSR